MKYHPRPNLIPLWFVLLLIQPVNSGDLAGVQIFSSGYVRVPER